MLFDPFAISSIFLASKSTAFVFFELKSEVPHSRGQQITSSEINTCTSLKVMDAAIKIII